MSKRNVPHFEDEDRGPQAEGMSDQHIQEESISEAQEESFSDSEMEEEAEESPLLTREMKIGLAVVLVLIMVLGALLVKRFTGAGGVQEDNQATAKAESKSTGVSSFGSSGSPVASPVPKLTGQQVPGSSSRSTPSSESAPWIPTNWGSGSKQPPSGTTRNSPESSTSPSLFPASAPPVASGSATDGREKVPGLGTNGGAGGGSGSGGTNPATSLGTMNPPGTGGSVFSGNNPLRTDRAVSPVAAPGFPKEVPPSPSVNFSGPLLEATNEPHATALQQRQRGGASPSLPGGSGSSTGTFSPYTPPAWGSPPNGLTDSGRGPVQAGSGAEKGAEGLTSPPSGTGLTTFPSGTRFPVPASATGGSPPSAGGQGSTPAASPAPSAPNDLFPISRSYVVQAGDSFWSISERFYGTGSYYQALAEYNRSLNPRLDQLRVGNQLMIPSQEELRRLYPQLCPAAGAKEAISASPGGAAGGGSVLVGGYPSAKLESSGPAGGLSDRPGSGTPIAPSGRTYRVYIVQEGDSIYEIARYLLGKASRWGEIYELNKEALGENLEYLPAGTRLLIPPAEPGNSPGPMSAVPTRNWPR